MASAGGGIAVMLFVVAVLSIMRDRYLGALAKLAWSVVALVLPIVGALLWFVVGKRYRYGVSGE